MRRRGAGTEELFKRSAEEWERLRGGSSVTMNQLTGFAAGWLAHQGALTPAEEAHIRGCADGTELAPRLRRDSAQRIVREHLSGETVR